jgi:hypothetical protein
MIEDFPEKLFDHVCVTGLVGVGKGIASRSDRPANSSEKPAMMPETIADIVQTNGVSELGMQQGYDMAPGRKLPCLFVDPVLPRQFGNQMARNNLADLRQNAQLGFGGW